MKLPIGRRSFRRQARHDAAASSVEVRAMVGSIEFANPAIGAAGTVGHGSEFVPFGIAGLGAVVVKSMSLDAWAGNPAQRVAGVDAGMSPIESAFPPSPKILCREFRRCAGIFARISRHITVNPGTTSSGAGATTHGARNDEGESREGGPVHGRHPTGVAHLRSVGAPFRASFTI